MPSRVTQVAVDAVDPLPVAHFWCAVLDYEIAEVEDEVISLLPRTGDGVPIDVLLVPDRKTTKNRLHLDVRADGVPRADELARLLALGAVPVDIGQGPDVSWTVLADPEGNEFCLLSQTVEEAAAER